MRLLSILQSVHDMKDGVIQTTSATFGAMAASFLQESFSHMIPWLMVSFAVVLCDLVTGIRKSLILGEKVRVSSACRRTLGKMVTYFAFVIMVCMICIASGAQYGIDKWSCLLVCFIEGISIMGNILKPKGYDIDFASAINLFFRKRFGGNKEDFEEIIHKTKTHGTDC